MEDIKKIEFPAKRIIVCRLVNRIFWYVLAVQVALLTLGMHVA